MKFAIVVLFLGLYSTGLVTEARHFKRRYDLSTEDEEASNNIVQCQTDIMGCAVPAFKYQAPDPIITVQKIKAAGAQQFCNDIKPILSCVSQKMKEPACRDYPDQFKSMITKGIRVGNLLCVDKINDVKKHWNCFLDIQSYSDPMPQCESEAEQLMKCNTAPLTNCLANLFKNKPGCDADVNDFVREVFPDIISIGITHCPDRPVLAQSFLDFMRFK